MYLLLLTRVDPKQFRHFVVQKTLARAVGLYPFTIDYKLRNGPFAGPAYNLFRGSRRGLNINFPVRNAVLLEKALGHPAVRAPKS